MEKVFNMDQTWLKCMHCGYPTNLLEERKFRCPLCGGLYDVNHDFDFLNSSDARADLRKVFDERRGAMQYGRRPWEYSGVWRYKELIMPYLPDDKIITLGEGIVPIMPAGKKLKKWIGGDIDLWVIFEGLSQSGSFKDFGMTVLVSIAKLVAQLLIAASTGDTSASAAAYAAAADLPCVAVLPIRFVTEAQIAQCKIHGVTIILVPGSFNDCIKIVEEIVFQEKAYPVNSLNPTRIEGHQATVFQIAQFLGWRLPNWIGAPVANGSNSSSIGKAVRLLKGLRLVPDEENTGLILGCQPAAANPLSGSWERLCLSSFERNIDNWKRHYRPIETEELGQTTATAARIGKPVSRDKVMREIVVSGGAMVTASEHDLNEGAAICAKDGYEVCPQTGAAVAGVKEAVQRGLIKRGETVFIVSTATGLKFTEPLARNAKFEMIEAPDCKTETVAKILGL